ncbi:hypothetical protein [Streptomyces phaeoluteigriseus]
MGLSLYAGWLTADDIRDRASSERDISAACDGLVSGAAVMDLRGGMVRAKTSDHDEFSLDGGEPHGSCTVYEVPGSGRTTGLLTLTVRASSPSEPLNSIGDDSLLEPFYRGFVVGREKVDVTAVADRLTPSWPIGDGTLGRYGNRHTTIRAACGTGSRATAPEMLSVTARADYENVSATDRERIARIARSAAQKVADRVGCRTQLASLPEELAAVPSALNPARTEEGTCQWFARHLRERGQGRLPDRALAVPDLDTSLVDVCLLAVGPGQVGRIVNGLDDEVRLDYDLPTSALTHAPWWMRSASYFGAEAHTVGFDETGQDVIIKAGTAGHANGAWWASSVCDGKPAIHTLSASYIYDNVLEPRALSALFHAYVDDITERRGCTHVTYPDPKHFRRH